MSNPDVERAQGLAQPPGTAAKARYANGANVAPSPFYYDPVSASGRDYKPWIIPIIVVIDVVLFIIEMLVNNCPAHTSPYGSCVGKFLRRCSFQPWKENPLLGPSSSTLDKMGALNWYKVVHGNQGWRLVSCIWLHAGLIHLLANMICLLFIGIRLEQQFGFLKVGAVYLLSGFGGSILSALFIQYNISVGASGALFGLLGAMLSELLINWTIYSNKVAALFNILIIAAINCAIGILPYVDNFAHIGGFLSGFLLGFILLIEPRYEYLRTKGRAGTNLVSKYAIYQIVLWAIALLLLIAGFAVGLIALFKGVNGNKHCSWCHYLTCVPTSSWKCPS